VPCLGQVRSGALHALSHIRDDTHDTAYTYLKGRLGAWAQGRRGPAPVTLSLELCPVSNLAPRDPHSLVCALFSHTRTRAHTAPGLERLRPARVAAVEAFARAAGYTDDRTLRRKVGSWVAGVGSEAALVAVLCPPMDVHASGRGLCGTHL
jgi:hypothetical protein